MSLCDLGVRCCSTLDAGNTDDDPSLDEPSKTLGCRLAILIKRHVQLLSGERIAHNQAAQGLCDGLGFLYRFRVALERATAQVKRDRVSDATMSASAQKEYLPPRSMQ
jgi:hypothetical protein